MGTETEGKRVLFTTNAALPPVHKIAQSSPCQREMRLPLTLCAVLHWPGNRVHEDVGKMQEEEGRESVRLRPGTRHNDLGATRLASFGFFER